MQVRDEAQPPKINSRDSTAQVSVGRDGNSPQDLFTGEARNSGDSEPSLQMLSGMPKVQVFLALRSNADLSDHLGCFFVKSCVSPRGANPLGLVGIFNYSNSFRN